MRWCSTTLRRRSIVGTCNARAVVAASIAPMSRRMPVHKSAALQQLAGLATGDFDVPPFVSFAVDEWHSDRARVLWNGCPGAGGMGGRVGRNTQDRSTAVATSCPSTARAAPPSPECAAPRRRGRREAPPRAGSACGARRSPAPAPRCAHLASPAPQGTQRTAVADASNAGIEEGTVKPRRHGSAPSRPNKGSPSCVHAARWSAQSDPGRERLPTALFGGAGSLRSMPGSITP